MSIQTITAEMAKGLSLTRNYGVIVSDVWPGGPAEKAGMKVGDILVSVDGQPADNLPTVNYNFRLRDSTENVQIVVLRSGKKCPSAWQRSSSAAIWTPFPQWPTPRRILCRNPVCSVSKSIRASPRARRGPRAVRDHRGRSRRWSNDGGPSSAARRHPQFQQSRHHVAAGAERRCARAHAWTPVTLQIQRDGRLMYVSFTLD